MKVYTDVLYPKGKNMLEDMYKENIIKHGLEKKLTIKQKEVIDDTFAKLKRYFQKPLLPVRAVFIS